MHCRFALNNKLQQGDGLILRLARSVHRGLLYASVCIKMEPNIQIGAGFDLSAGIRIEGINPNIFTRVTLASTSWALPTACYSVNLGEGVWSEVGAQPTRRAVRGVPVAAPAARITNAPEAKRAVPFMH